MRFSLCTIYFILMHTKPHYVYLLLLFHVVGLILLFRSTSGIRKFIFGLIDSVGLGLGLVSSGLGVGIGSYGRGLGLVLRVMVLALAIKVDLLQLEIRSVEHGICPIAEFTSPLLSCAAIWAIRP